MTMGLLRISVRAVRSRAYSSIQRRRVSTVYRDAESLVSIVREKVGEEHDAHVFVGLGQYYGHRDQSRMILLRLGDNWTPYRNAPPRELADIATDQLDIRELVDVLRHRDICRSVLVGELDCVGESDWKFGFITGSEFSIFSRQGFVLQPKSFFTGSAFLLHSNNQIVRFCPGNVTSVRVEISEEPWEDRKLSVELINGEHLTVLESSNEHTLDTSDADLPLARLMMSTEWLVKAAAQICLASSHLDQTSKRPNLLLPQILREEGNMWVQMRNEAWARGAASQVPLEE